MAALTFKEAAYFGQRIHATVAPGDFVDAARALVQELYAMEQTGVVRPCTACSAHRGLEGCDADQFGNGRWRNCPVCDGWGVC